VEHLALWCAEPRLVTFAALAGFDWGEILALRETEIDLDDGSVLVVRAARKGVEGRTKTRKRYGHLYPGSAREAAAALDRHLNAVAS
jgi:integrase